ncbi:metallophosphoesterase family protein [Ectobacillus antri]|uniref:metallophosphoesterase family protein n=1 Tax=Ectobacillus antri TaxID=2486280 RepID=UPI000F5B7A3E|nr:metallophosphoesterase family protein [Ectobacillus antri]
MLKYVSELIDKKEGEVLRFAVMTDIHGNAPALRAVLHEIDRMRDIEHIYCLGDMIAIGPDTNEVLDMLFARHDVTMVTGNHDEAVLALVKGEMYPQSHAQAREHHQWIAERLNPVFIPKLAALPRTIQQEIQGHRFLFMHYQLAKPDAPISDDPFSAIVEPTLANMRQLFANCEADCICFGHHHPVHDFRSTSPRYINPGALGCGGFAPYAIVTVGATIEVELCAAIYEKEEFLASYEQLGVPDRAFILRVFHQVN